MADSASDTESSCGWTVISNEGSDIETLGPENGLECGADLLDSTLTVDPELQDLPAPLKADDTEETPEQHDSMLREEIADEPASTCEAVMEPVVKDPMVIHSCSDQSDIVTFGDLKEHSAPEGESAVSEELYLGTSHSSQYAFSAAETAVYPVQPPMVLDSSSSSEDEAGEALPSTLRRRRPRKSTSSMLSQLEDRVSESAHSEGEQGFKEEVLQESQPELQPQGTPTSPAFPNPDPPLARHLSGTLNRCILLALVIAISMGFGHFHGTAQIQERQKTVERLGLCGLDISKDPPQPAVSKEVIERLREDLDGKQAMLDTLMGKMNQITKENQELRSIQAQLQAEKDKLEKKLQLTTKKKSQLESNYQKMETESQMLTTSLAHEEKSLSTLQEEVKHLRAQIRELEERGAAADSIWSENERLKNYLEDEKLRIRRLMVQKDAMLAEVQALLKQINEEKKTTIKLQDELELLRRDSTTGTGDEAQSEMEELQLRLQKLESALNFERQRSDLWERLYVETKEERAKGDTQSRVKKNKGGMMGKVKDTFDAVKNSTKEFVHHHKEQIKMAKEAVKENLRKFSDSVKSTFRYFRDKASPWTAKPGKHNKKFNDKKDARESWQQRTQKPFPDPHKPDDSSFQGDHNTRKSGDKVHEEQDRDNHGGIPRGCSGVFECAYQESMSLFNKAMDPVRADEFNQLLHSYLQQEVDHFRHWKELEKFINNFFHNGVFIHDRMLFTDFVSDVEGYLEDMPEYHDDDVFEDLDDYVYRHFFGETHSKLCEPRGPDTETRESERPHGKKQPRKQQRARPRLHRESRWSGSGRDSDRHMADVKIELGPMPFDPKY